jgi:4-hydroxy-tetrahydrodipicolinate synthase
MMQRYKSPEQPMSRFSLITAIGTPLNEDEEIHVQGLEKQIEYQWAGGMTGILVGGTMCEMQLLSDKAYQQLVDHSIEFARGQGEVMVGAGDASFARTKQRIEFLNQRKIDAVVVLTPYLLKFSQAELVEYFKALADESAHPLYLYDLPIYTGTKLSMETVQRVAEHPNIHGIKASCDVGWTRSLLDLNLPDFRVIVAAANLIDVLMRAGVKEHLDGVFALHPHWVSEVARASERQDWDAASAAQRRIIQILNLLHENGVMATFTVLMNLLGIPGCFAPRPYRRHDAAKAQAIARMPIVQELLASRARGNGQHVASPTLARS